MSSSRGTPTGRNGGTGSTGSTNASPFIKHDRNRRNFLRAKLSNKDVSNGSIVKKEDPDLQEKRDHDLLKGVENRTNKINIKVKGEDNEVYNEFPLRAISKENLENMRTHLLKFQSKKVIKPLNDFHLPIRLHRKDTRNLQFQLTRAEIVQRQKEIMEYKKTQQAGGNTNANQNFNAKSYSTKNKHGSGVQDSVANKSNNTKTYDASTPVADSTIKTEPQTTTNLADDVKPLIENSDVKQEPTTELNNLQNDAQGKVQDSTPTSVDINGSTTKMITKLEEAGIAEDPTKVGMVRYDGEERVQEKDQFEEGTVDPLADIAPDGGGRAKRGNLRRKTRQIKVLDENAKKLRFEEFYPWVMEDFDGYNTWVGSYEAGNSDSYVLLSVEDDGSFTMIPADKVYKFTARNKYATLTIEEAEKRMDKKSGEVPRWLMKHLDNIGTTTTRYDRTKRRLKAVADQRRSIEGSESEHDDNSEVELDYDEEFADDEEAPIIDGNEQENKESEKRIKKEMLQANAMGLRDTEEVPDELNKEDDLFTEKKMDEEGERMKKALQKTELAALYSDDDGEINPYLSESDIEKQDKENEKDKEKENEKGSNEGSPVKKENSEESKISKRASPKKSRKTNKESNEPQIIIKSIKDCVIVLKANKKVLENFAPGEWNPEVSKRKREEMELNRDAVDSNGNLENDESELPAAKKIKTEDSSDVPIITEQDIMDAIGDGKVNVKDFGKSIRKKYPGSANKKLMFAIVKKLCRKVDNEHMELKNKPAGN
ncbi:hypothetical protein TPHA_0N00620 [Tetrapisispora phaffii CBS 4417]|uniref:Transcription initiation factor IIF subunit alpha n=1 Tax=Tetrapisispora phaffii (strain ATCC 24235 / CBS 4417 / NBRC 1672 / NRRL Y-8282 / UCD 70-5) TaxID=1071381 RepID=G8C115_TETPH|nr:hypothetical protein TPHA_0N00620 [Tetrapisispora phaffii CBS 4417]CCE65843.1 hypothetical protein TPHA_0N00620 [Tetrapisispora phaffii CBS 4417]